MNTKHIAVIFTALLSVFTMGCESFLKTDPPLDISNEIALSTPAGIGAALVGAADGMQSGALFGGNTISIGELWSNNVEASVGADFGRLQIISYNLNIFNPEGRALWQDGYGVINRVNNVLAACENVTFEDPALKQRYRGRALAMRGMTMFQLCTYFAQPWGFTSDNSHPGIVIRTEPTLGDAGTRKARATLKECYEQIVADLTAAAELLPPTDAPFMGALATKAYLARVCFHMGDVVRAEALTTEVINSGAYRLNQDVTSVVSTNSTRKSSGRSSTRRSITQLRLLGTSARQMVQHHGTGLARISSMPFTRTQLISVWHCMTTVTIASMSRSGSASS